LVDSYPVLPKFLPLLSKAEVFSVIVLRREALFSSPIFPQFFKAVHAQFCFVLRFNGGDQVEMKMIGKKYLVPDMHCLLINKYHQTLACFSIKGETYKSSYMITTIATIPFILSYLSSIDGL